MESNDRNPIFTKRNIIIGGAVLLLLIIAIFFLVACNRKTKVEKIEVSQTNLSIAPGETFLLKSNVYPSNASNKDLQYTSTDPSVATVDDKGMITALKAGKTQIVIKSPDTDFVAACDIVISNNPDTATAINFDNSDITINRGMKQLLTTRITPDTAKVPTLMFASSNSNIVSVDKDGYIVGNAIGTAIITVTGNSGTSNNLTTTTKVTVVESSQNNNPDNNVGVTGITLNKTSLSLDEGKEYQLVADLTATGGIPTVTWNSSNPNAAIVDKTGRVTAVKAGTATITATAGGKTVTTTVTVVSPSTSNNTTDNTNPNNTNSDNSGSNNNNTNTNTDNSNTNTNTNTNTNPSPSDTSTPSISFKVTGTQGNSGWYKSVVTLGVTIGNSTNVTAKYCVVSAGSTCTPSKTIPTNGITIGNGKWVLYFNATNNVNKKITTTSKQINVDFSAPICKYDVSDEWEDNKKVTFSAVDYISDVRGIRYNGYMFLVTSKYIIEPDGTYSMTCEDIAGNTATATVRIISQTEYAYRTCKSCTITSYNAWIKKSQSCYTINKTPSKYNAEKDGMLEYYECTLQSGTGNGCTKGQYYCRYYTRTVVRNCLTGCVTWSPWSDYSTIIQNALRTKYQYKEIKKRTTYNVG